jgi:hypothetical protein
MLTLAPFPPYLDYLGGTDTIQVLARVSGLAVGGAV